MGKDYLKKLIKYMKQVYHIDDALKGLTDTSVKPRYSTGETILPVLFGFLLRMQSFNELKYRLKNNDFKNIIAKKIKLPQIDTIKDTLKVLDMQGLRKMHSSIIKKAKENKVLREGTIPVIHVKDNNITSIKEVKTKTNKGSIKEEWYDSKI